MLSAVTSHRRLRCYGHLHSEVSDPGLPQRGASHQQSPTQRLWMAALEHLLDHEKLPAFTLQKASERSQKKSHLLHFLSLFPSILQMTGIVDWRTRGCQLEFQNS